MTSANGQPDVNGVVERIALYLRVSSDEQRDRETIEIQRQFLEEYCKLYGLEVAETYEDDGVSGTVPLHERPEGRRLLEDAREGKFDTVIVYKLDRFGRTLMVIVDAHDRLETASASLRSAREPIDTSNPSGRLIFQMLASFAEYDRENIKERTRAGLHRAFRNGRYTGRAPYSYRLDEDARLVIVDAEAEIVVEIITDIAEGSTLYGVAKRLNDLGIPSPGRHALPGASWSTSTISNIIRQGAYSGVHEVKIDGGKDTIVREAPAIVDRGLQLKALSRLAENKRYSGGKQSRDYLLAGLVKCGVCGFSCAGHSTTARGKTYFYYRCNNGKTEQVSKGVPHRGPSPSAPWLEELVWDDCRRFLRNPGEVLERVKEQAENTGHESGGLEQRLASLSKRLATKQAEKDRYVKLYAAGHLDEAELDVYMQDIRNQVENLKLLISSVEADLSHAAQDKELAATTEAWLMSLRANLDAVEQNTEEAFAKRRELVKLLVDSIVADFDENGALKVDITYRFGPPGEAGKDVVVDGVPHSSEISLPKRS